MREFSRGGVYIFQFLIGKGVIVFRWHLLRGGGVTISIHWDFLENHPPWDVINDRSLMLYYTILQISVQTRLSWYFLRTGAFPSWWDILATDFTLRFVSVIAASISRAGEWSSENWESRQILPKSQNLAELSNGFRSPRFCVCRSHICFSIKSLHSFVSGSDFKMPVSASRRVSDFTIRHPYQFKNCIFFPTGFANTVALPQGIYKFFESTLFIFITNTE